MHFSRYFLVFSLNLIVLLQPASAGIKPLSRKEAHVEHTRYVPVAIQAPATFTELQKLVFKAQQEQRKISVIGAGKSQGGQTSSSQPNTCRISLHKINKVVSFNRAAKEITVEAGMTWAQLQDYIKSYGLAVLAMQSYSDFSIGGSLSVNVHGQDVRAAPLIKTVKSFKLLLHDGQIITVTRDHPNANYRKLFKLALGGYGLFGIITEVTLRLTDDIMLEKHTQAINASKLADYFLKKINDPATQFISGRFSISDSDLLEKVLVITYKKASGNNAQASPDTQASIKREKVSRKSINWMSIFSPLKKLRFWVEENIIERPETVSRNTFMSATLNSLPSDTTHSQYILQEYFIPYKYISQFIFFLRDIIQAYEINILNVTARHIPKDSESMLAYARQDMCAFVLYIKIPKDTCYYPKFTKWTRALVNEALALDGCYYLPYHLLATREQVHRAYPTFKAFIELKKIYDPQELFSNKLYEQYK